MIVRCLFTLATKSSIEPRSWLDTLRGLVIDRRQIIQIHNARLDRLLLLLELFIPIDQLLCNRWEAFIRSAGCLNARLIAFKQKRHAGGIVFVALVAVGGIDGGI